MLALHRENWLFCSRSLVAASLCAAFCLTGCKGGDEQSADQETTQAPPAAAGGSGQAAVSPRESFISLDETLAAAADTPTPVAQPQQSTAPADQPLRLTGRLQKELELPNAPSPQIDEQVRQLLKIAGSAQQKEDYGPARQFFQQALDLAKQHWPADSWRVRDLERAIQVNDQFASLDPQQRAAVKEAGRLHMMAYQRASQGDFDAATDHLQRAQELREPVLGTQHMTAVRAHGDFLQWTIMQGNLEEAQRLAEPTLQETIQFNGELHPETAILWWALGDLQLALENHGQADTCYERALYVLRVTAPSDEEYPHYLMRLSSIYQTQNRYFEAEQAMLESAEIRRITRGETSEEYVGTLMSLGALYLTANQHNLADAAFSQVLARTQGRAELGTLRATVLVYQSRSLIEQGELARAASMLDEALALREATSGRRDIMYASALYIRADLYMRQQQFAQAEATLQETAQIYETLGRAGLASHSACVHRIVTTQLELGKVADARRTCNALMRAHKIMLGDEDPLVIGDKALEARVCLAEGNVAQAEALAREAATTLQDDPNQRVRHSFCQHTLGDVLSAQGKAAEAAQQLEQALATQQSLLRVADLHLLLTTESYATALHQLGRNDEAAAYEARAATYRGRMAAAGGSTRR